MSDELLDNFNTEPEISITPSTESEDDPQRGNEAESRLHLGVEASTSVPSEPTVNKGVGCEVADLYEKDQVCPRAHYFSGDPQAYQNFCREFNIPANVMLNHVASDRIKDKAEDRPKHITVSLMAICEAGLQFPLHPFLRELLARFSLAPHQLAINSYRIIMSVIALKESHRLTFAVANLFETYIMSRHRHPERWYLSTRRKKESLITGLPDTDKWANFYVKVLGNYEFGDLVNRQHSVPKVKDTRGPSRSFI